MGGLGSVRVVILAGLVFQYSEYDRVLLYNKIQVFQNDKEKLYIKKKFTSSYQESPTYSSDSAPSDPSSPSLPPTPESDPSHHT